MGRCKMTFGACQSTLGPVQDDPLNVSIDPWRVSAGAGRVLLRQNPSKSPENPHGDPFRPAGLIELALTHRHSVPRRDPWIIFYFLPADPSGGENPSRPFRSTSMGKAKINGEPQWFASPEKHFLFRHQTTPARTGLLPTRRPASAGRRVLFCLRENPTFQMIRQS